MMKLKPLPRIEITKRQYLIIIGHWCHETFILNHENFTPSWLLGSLSIIYFVVCTRKCGKDESLKTHIFTWTPQSLWSWQPWSRESVSVMLGLWRWLRLCGGGCWRAVIWKCCGSGLAVAGPGLGSQVAAETPGWPLETRHQQLASLAQSPPWHTHTHLPATTHNCNTSRINDHTVSPPGNLFSPQSQNTLCTIHGILLNIFTETSEKILCALKLKPKQWQCLVDRSLSYKHL